MADITINYKGEEIASTSESGTTTLNTAGKFCEGNISVEYDRPETGTIIVQIPTVTVGTYTYNGSAQGPTISEYDSEHILVTNATKTAAGTYTLTLALANTQEMIWTDLTTADKTYEYTINKLSITPPTVSGSYTYDGSSKSASISYVTGTNDYITQGGIVSAVNAGTYTVTFTLKDTNNTKWSDNTTSQKSETWSISKATPTLTISKNSMTLNSDKLFDTATVTYNGDGTVSASSSNTSAATVSYSNGIVTVSSVNGTTGTATITISASAGDNYNAASTSISVSAEFLVLVSWSSGTDAQITAMINAYYNGSATLNDIKSVWSIGDIRNITISAMSATGVGESHRSQTVSVQILGFEHDDLTTAINGKSKALITVDLKNCLRDANVSDTGGSSNTEHGYMNSTNTNNGGWTSCARRTWCNNVFYNALPSYMKNLVKPVNKKTSAGNQSSTINTDSDKCFLLSEIEIFGSVTHSKSGEGSQYAWYANAVANRYKLPGWGSSGVSDIWWERSPYGSSSNYFCYVTGSGGAGYLSASGTYGLAPAWAL